MGQLGGLLATAESSVGDAGAGVQVGRWQGRGGHRRKSRHGPIPPRAEQGVWRAGRWGPGGGVYNGRCSSCGRAPRREPERRGTGAAEGAGSCGRARGLKGRTRGGALLCPEARSLLSEHKRGGSEHGGHSKELGAWAEGPRRASS